MVVIILWVGTKNSENTVISLSTVCKSTCVCRCAQLYTIKCPAHPFCKPSPPSLPPPVPVPVDRQRHWFTTEDAIIQTSRRPPKQHYLIAACKQTQLHSQQILQPLSSPSLPPLSSSSSSHSISYRTTLLSSLLLTCTLVLCVGLYNIIIILIFYIFIVCM